MHKPFVRSHVRWLSVLVGVFAALFLSVAMQASTAFAASTTGRAEAVSAGRVRGCFQGASARCPNRIVFRRGATSARVFGRLFGINDHRFFVLRARAGQHMKVTITGAGPTRGIVFFPGGGSSGMPGGVIFDENLPRTGDYIIEVSESMMGEAWVGDFRLDVSIR